ncbi:MAG TPA: PPOX class F420-dependent oxidoreductase [Chloroflexota bacterium]|jgi:pyridoxamine 5'-phosphate oxidase family protein|nr:PPOX class F420-dependent oxidoreductase [Chloroflexota bacterium]
MTSTFTEAELEYLKHQRLARLATVGPDGRPHVMPVGFFYEPETQAIVIGSTADMAASKKFRDAQRHPQVALVVDDFASVDPWRPRGIEIRGRAETHTDGGEAVGKRLNAPFPFDRAWIRIRPQRVLSWGIESDAFAPSARDVA